jgi:branched-subunit amino acid ABC-type transport system permease component
MNQVIQSIGFGLVSASIVSLGAVGFTLQYGVSHIFNLAYGAVMTVAAYLAYVVNVDFHQSIWIALVVGAGGAAVISVAMQWLIYAPFQRRGLGVFALVQASLAITVIVQNLLLAFAGADFKAYTIPQERSFHIGPIVWTRSQVIIMIIAVLVVVALHVALRASMIGKAIRAVAADPELARNCGVDTRKITATAWGASGALCGLAGVALAINTYTFTSDSGGNFLLLVVAAAAVGGVGNPYGALIGGLTIGIVTELTALVAPELKDVAAVVVLVIVLFARPEEIRIRLVAMRRRLVTT